MVRRRSKYQKPAYPCKSRPSGLSMQSYFVCFIGGELDGRSQKVPIPKPVTRTNRPYINKSSWTRDDTGWLKYDNWYVAEQVCRPKVDQAIRYFHNAEGLVKLEGIFPADRNWK